VQAVKPFSIREFEKAQALTVREWSVIARAVLAGRYDRADRSTLESITIGLRSLPAPECKAALKRIEKL
jgi:hypothetical protein